MYTKHAAKYKAKFSASLVLLGLKYIIICELIKGYTINITVRILLLGVSYVRINKFHGQ